jgi:ADP-heptose:LPS heptosyltransferase
VNQEVCGIMIIKEISLFLFIFRFILPLSILDKRFLIVRTDRVGDVVMITPMIREIKKKYPDSFLATLTNPNTAYILMNNPYIDEIIIDDLNKNSFWKVVKQLRELHFTDGLLAIPTERAAYQMMLAGIKTKIGEGHKLYELISGTRSVDRHKYIPLKHETDYCMDTARKIGIKSDNLELEIYVTEEEKKEAMEVLAKFGVEINDYKIMIHTGSLGSSPNWSEDKYLLLLKEIVRLEIPDMKIFLTAIEMSDSFLKNVALLNDKRILDISGIWEDLRKFIKIISVTDLFISNSTGPLHIADALNLKCIGINCSRPMNSVKYWGILNKYSINIEVSEEYCDKNCSPNKEKCNFENGISVEQVINGIITLLN